MPANIKKIYFALNALICLIVAEVPYFSSTFVPHFKNQQRYDFISNNPRGWLVWERGLEEVNANRNKKRIDQMTR